MKELTYEEAKAQWEKLLPEFLEMGQLKSDFDMEKFTIAREGPFIAHCFHMLMRQYVFALSESMRMNIDIERKRRKIARLKEEQASGEKDDLDLDILQTENELNLQRVTAQNKIQMCYYFEKLRERLIELNGEPFTNEQYQEEVPRYWKWVLSQKALDSINAKRTGIDGGILENLHFLERPATINKDFEVSIPLFRNGQLDERQLLFGIFEPTLSLEEKVQILRQIGEGESTLVEKE